MDKQTVVDSYSEDIVCVPHHKKEQTSDISNNMDDYQNIVLSGKSQKQKYSVCTVLE